MESRISRSMRCVLVSLFAAALAAPAGSVQGAENPSGGRPRIAGVRAIQYGYGEDPRVVVIWSIEDGSFDQIIVTIEEIRVNLSGAATGVQFQGVGLGLHTVAVEGILGGEATAATAEVDVLPESPLPPAKPYGCIYHGHDPDAGTGSLKVSWIAEAADPWYEFEIFLDGRFMKLVPAGHDATTLEGVSPGDHEISVMGLTLTHAAPPAVGHFRAVPLAGPRDLRFSFDRCSGGRGKGRLLYEIPDGVRYDAIAIWVQGGESLEWDFRGYMAPSRSLSISDLPEGRAAVEIAGALFTDDGEFPYALSNLPDRSGTHASAAIWVNCAGRIEFRRGDAASDGRVNLSDAIRILGTLFLSAGPLPCPPAGDIDADGKVDITDPIALLSFLFMGGVEPPLPGPRICGEDPAFAGTCGYDACGAGSF